MFQRETCQFLGAEIKQLKKNEISPKLEDRNASLWNKILKIGIYKIYIQKIRTRRREIWAAKYRQFERKAIFLVLHGNNSYIRYEF